MNDTITVTTPHGTYPVNRNWLAIHGCINRWQRIRQDARNERKREARFLAAQQPVTIAVTRARISRERAA